MRIYPKSTLPNQMAMSSMRSKKKDLIKVDAAESEGPVQYEVFKHEDLIKVDVAESEGQVQYAVKK